MKKFISILLLNIVLVGCCHNYSNDSKLSEDQEVDQATDKMAQESVKK